MLWTLCYFNDAALNGKKIRPRRKRQEGANSSLPADIEQRMGFWLKTEYRKKFGKKLINYLDKRSLNSNVERKGNSHQINCPKQGTRMDGVSFWMPY